MKTVLTIQPCEWGIGRLGQLLKHSISFFRLFNIIGTIFFPVTIKIFLCERVFCFCFFLIVISFFLFFLTSMFIYIFFWQSSLQLFLWYDNILEREKKEKGKKWQSFKFFLKIQPRHFSIFWSSFYNGNFYNWNCYFPNMQQAVHWSYRRSPKEVLKKSETGTLDNLDNQWHVHPRPLLVPETWNLLDFDVHLKLAIQNIHAEEATSHPNFLHLV